MAFSIATLTPFNVQLGGIIDPSINEYSLLPAPVAVGGGSVTDDSDATYLEMGSRFNSDEGGDMPDSFMADFYIDPALYPNPTWMYPSIRAKNIDGYLDHLANDHLTPVYLWFRTDSPGAYPIYQTNWPSDLRNGLITSPTWLNQVYNNKPILPGDPGDDTNWLNLPRDWPEFLDPITTTGLRFGIYCLSSSLERIPLVDLFEVRLVVAYEAADAPVPVAAARSTPSLRMLQRGGQGGMSGIPRMVGNPVRGLRQGPGSVY